jgi:hypothetical protein
MQGSLRERMLERIRRALRVFPPVYWLSRAVYRALVRPVLTRSRRGREIAALRDAGLLAPPTLSVKEQQQETATWQEAGRPIPPPPTVKQMIVTAYGQHFGMNTLVETGTYLGQMVEAQRGTFAHVWSIELDKALARMARQRFADAKNVTILQGDSGEHLKDVLAASNEPCLFWLDAHYSAGITARGDTDTPIMLELGLILTTPWEHVILIDDARCFGADDFPDYPTVDEIRSIAAKHRDGWAVTVQDDIIRIHSGAPWMPPSP